MGNQPDAKLKILKLRGKPRFDGPPNPREAPALPAPPQKQKIRAINDYIFSEMRFRFPRYSLHAKDIDVYTFLPSVLDSRQGVCLGVSILYLSLAQRLELPLEAITPPGHIYVRYKGHDGDILNIETTARGIDVPSELYLGIDTKDLQQRNLREVIGLAFMNQAAVSWHKEDPTKAVFLYEKARPFLGNDYLLNMFLGFNYLFIGKEAEGRKLLEKVRGVVPPHSVVGETVSEDYLAGLTDADGIQATFPKSTRAAPPSSKSRKTRKLSSLNSPNFGKGSSTSPSPRSRSAEKRKPSPSSTATPRSLYPGDPTVNYYLSAIHFQRRNHTLAWGSTSRPPRPSSRPRDHDPHALQELKEALQRACPAP